MIKYKFQPNEGQLMRCDALLLTTQHLVWKQFKGFSNELIICPFNEVRVVNEKVQAFISGEKGRRSLEILFVNGEHKKFNVAFNIEKDKDQQAEILKWLKSINVAVTGEEGDFEELERSITGNKNTTAIANMAGVGRALGENITSTAFGGGIVGDIVGGTIGGAVGGIVGGTIGVFKHASGSKTNKSEAQSQIANEKVSAKCSCCGAPIAGKKGQIVRCQYCDSNQHL